jgi:hypothetical protein
MSALIAEATDPAITVAAAAAAKRDIGDGPSIAGEETLREVTGRLSDRRGSR